jgi:amino acid transporter
LLTGIAGMLNVISGRLSRIIDRARTLTGNQFDIISSGQESEDLMIQLQKLEKRRHYTSIAITACTIAALLVCTVIAALFFEVLFGVTITWIVAFLFMAATLALVLTARRTLSGLRRAPHDPIPALGPDER